MRRALLVAMAVALVLVAVAACGGPRNSLNTGSSVCFRSLAVAREAVAGQGRMVGVHRVRASSYLAHFPDAAPTTDDVCLVAFHGDYKAGQVKGAPPQASGPYAVVAVTTGKASLLGSVVGEHLPFRFAHRT